MMTKITSEVLHELVLLKKSDYEKFLQRIEELALGSMDILLTYKKFKEYPANI
ncbi:MAG TPA: hypothetical protein VMC84_10870 [Methanocella sp.]|uniref:hypothetical protein n=1 Tax=Methanocella sp. TaxID=2052833 RepID=UPI002C1DD1D4|nr:hypothetical protein [Methanocella sp.]HTY91667.1 hypothetical protein [Methanocella sp.]